MSFQKISSGKDHNWLFIPGGPGLGEEYLSVALKNISLKGTIYTYRFPLCNENFTDQEILKNIENEIMTFLRSTKKTILVGHSFGGMLLQTLNLDPKSYEKMILLNSAPDLKCFEVSASTYANCSLDEKTLMDQSQQTYNLEKSHSNLKRLYKSWSPYYVLTEHLKAYDEMIENCSIDYLFWEWGNRYFFPIFEQIKKPLSNLTIINSKNDKICPAHLFNAYPGLKENVIELDLTSHFPWLEDKALFENVLKKIEG